MSARADKPRKRRDYRLAGLAVVAIAAAAIGLLVEALPGRGIDASTVQAASRTDNPPGFEQLRETKAELQPESAPASADTAATGNQAADRKNEIDTLLRAAEKHIREKRYDDAIALLNKAGPLDPQYPPTYLNMGHALAGKRNYALARRYYEAAINFDPSYADAYFAHAAASEQLGDLETALGGMRSFLHTVKNPDPYRLQVAQARSAIWEWEAQLGRGPWGDTRGIPPGFTAEELRRDGKGVGTKMPIPSTASPDGVSRYEIKTSERFNIFKP
ncbi:MAG TPA: tetratricopeptide repeat protein [Noviherbaspirillum sp.]